MFLSKKACAYITKSSAIILGLLWIIGLIFLPYRPLISILKTDLYFGNHNGFLSPEWNEKSIFWWAYLFIIFITVTFYYFRSAFFAKKGEFYKILFLVTACVYAVLVEFQTMSQNKFFSNNSGIVYFTTERKLFFLLGNSYRFAKYGQQLFHNSVTGKLITDLDLTQTLEPYIIRYVLFPKIDMLTQEDSPGSLVVYEKINPEGSIPPGYKIVGVYNKSGLYAKKQ